MTEPAVDSTAVEEPGTEVAVRRSADAALFRTTDPREILDRAVAVADALAPVVERKKLYAVIGRGQSARRYPTVEAWTVLGQMLGVSAMCEWTHRLEDGWEARVVVARMADGHEIGAAEAQCTRAERVWKDRDDFALRSMSQTRATAKALRSVLGFILTLAGYEATPEEEMPGDIPREPQRATPPLSWREAAEGLDDRTIARLFQEHAKLHGVDAASVGGVWDALTDVQQIALMSLLSSEIRP